MHEMCSATVTVDGREKGEGGDERAVQERSLWGWGP